MRYTVNYEGAFFTGDSEGFNVFETDSWDKARELFYCLYYAGFKGVYVKDEEYQCTFRYDERDDDFVWEDKICLLGTIQPLSARKFMALL